MKTTVEQVTVNGVQEILKTITSPLTKPDGSLVTSPAEWPRQREYIKQLLQEHVYGPMPEMTDNITMLSQSAPVTRFDGKAVDQYWTFTADKMYPEFQFGVRIVRPVTDKKVPVLFMVQNNSAVEGYFYPYTQDIVEHGYALVLVDRELATPEVPDADVGLWTDSSVKCDEYLYYLSWNRRTQTFPDRNLPIEEYMKQYPYVHKYGKIALGAHCVRLAISVVEGMGFGDPKCFAVTGHSRDGKVSLCAGVFDERLSVVVPQGSGCGGVGLYKIPAKGKEQIDDMVRVWPSWLPALARYRDGRAMDMPLDMHFARACIAPRAVMNTEGLSDFWAGPYSSYVGRYAAQPAFELMGVPHSNGMYLRTGFHEMNRGDIHQTLCFCDYIWYGVRPEYDFDLQQPAVFSV